MKTTSGWKASFSKLGVLTLAFMMVFSIVVLPQVNAGEVDPHELVIMTTTDLHSYMMDYDYMNDEPVDDYGMVRTATLIDQIRANHENTLLFDVGDTIQGSLLGELEAMVEPIQAGETQAIIQAMNALDYDAAAIGNHEFNFGLEFMENTVATSDFPWLSANVYKAGTNLEEHYFEPYTIMEHEIDGESINIGLIGFVPPQIMNWDRLHLEGEVEVRGIAEAAERYVPEVKAAGADLVIALSHTGINTSDRASEHAALDLSKVEGIDAIGLGHAHTTFPGSSRFDGMEGIDNVKGTLNGVPAVMAGSWGSHLGTITLDLVQEDDSWAVVDGRAEVTGVTETKPNQEIAELIQEQDEETIDYANSPVGKMATSLNTHFSRVMDNEVVQFVNDAQLWYTNNYFAGTEYEDMPILSAAAPFRAGYRGGYTEVDAGGISVRDMTDIYIYPNTLQVVKVDGDELVKWLERSAENFNQIDPNETADQDLIASFSAFNFDVIEGVEYEIDVTKPAGERIVDLTYDGQEVTSDMEFLVATNNYRAGGGGDHLDDAEIVLSSTSENRGVLIDYIGQLDEYVPHTTNNWSLAPVETEGRVVFTSSPEATEQIEEQGLKQVSPAEDDEILYEYNLDYQESPSFWDRIKGFWTGLWN
ncbi:bifunctional 2',3'-cyclic-nucleotide 2'-phosphodiesterase/3'-nucleotidase [Natroniella sp. ANB-PHB2]|uniref:bifunctional 2',3'-cyclic-nucleotide 2'-phosphodiesterase/3'-nucleotidase n=1 Tax=Natroniella sp. ANB-PHB2 TaxID=3384444 RepID=UPI0038D40719